MRGLLLVRNRLTRVASSLLAGEADGSQIVEFAISLPLLMVFVVGIFDFGSAFTVKQKVAYIAQEAARVGSNQPTNDLLASGNCTNLVAVCTVRDVVQHSLVSNKLRDCGLGSVAPAVDATPLTWKFTASTNCPGTLELIVRRGYSYTTTLAAPFSTDTYTIDATLVTLKYPYQWQFNRVIKLIVPSANFTGPAQINSTAVMQNLN